MLAAVASAASQHPVASTSSAPTGSQAVVSRTEYDGLVSRMEHLIMEVRTQGGVIEQLRGMEPKFAKLTYDIDDHKTAMATRFEDIDARMDCINTAHFNDMERMEHRMADVEGKSKTIDPAVLEEVGNHFQKTMQDGQSQLKQDLLESYRKMLQNDLGRMREEVAAERAAGGEMRAELARLTATHAERLPLSTPDGAQLPPIAASPAPNKALTLGFGWASGPAGGGQSPASQESNGAAGAAGSHSPPDLQESANQDSAGAGHA
ncbi:hypothetical protein EWM64_g8068 [Hericium alpestre]|uniref:Uncharacterized protein n=1 Tax=Hericium alpestre TaxID=135208 RepID=A0A4Y9ZNV8_9AGAM|nr:hypothetical protein EWM64_g8068 [Hericium alpestre]